MAMMEYCKYNRDHMQKRLDALLADAAIKVSLDEIAETVILIDRYDWLISQMGQKQD
jgi:hypothetical protein